MADNSTDRLTLARCFLEPANSKHRQYEALRAFFVDQIPSAEAAARFGYTPGSFRVLVHQFRKQPDRDFFVSTIREGRPPGKQKRLREQVISLRKQNLSVHDISRALARDGESLSPAAIAVLLKEEGFAKLPRRGDDERPDQPRPLVADVADVRQLDLTPRHFRTKFGGLFLFLPWIVSADLPKLLTRSGFPGSKMVPAACAMRSLLALKLFGNARHSHVMSAVLDEGLALFAGLNVVPKRSFLTEYSCRVAPACYPKLMRDWFDTVSRLGLKWGTSFDLDFHTIPYHGDDALVEKHYVSKRSRRQKGMLAFLAQDADTRVFCYANGELRKDQQNDEVLRFVEFWKQRTGRLPEELIFDSKLTTYANLDRLNRKGIQFITLRRRSKKLLGEIAQTPASAWRRVELESTSRAYKTPRVLDRRITLKDYDGPLRQLTIADLGHEEPTLLLTNQLTRSAAQLIGRYAQRMLIENNIEDGIDFFHMDALSSVVALKINCDLQLTLMASSLYRLLAVRVGNGYESAKSRHLFRDFIDATAGITITEGEVVVKFQKRAHNPLLLAAGFDKTDSVVPWLGKKRLRLVFG
ncbi:MAG: transposase [Planctomycetaceae bacterium]|nr:transposase [Planctomycetaceae bacterium]MBV8317236.1 transposase [Planctomycetaceae bacterium]MBV8675828.1 transposase [Planctomycetaceae bacterium]